MKPHILCLVGALSCVSVGCDRDAATPTATAKPMPTAPSSLPDAVDPVRLPKLEPPTDPASNVQGLTIQVDAARRQVALRYEGPTPLVGQTTFVLAWVGEGKSEALPWRQVGTLMGGCETPDAVEPVHTHRGTLDPGSSVTWELPATQAQFCAGREVRSMATPPGRYRVGATFRAEPAGAQIAVWSMPFELTR